jgi:hypothetical protein
VIRAVLFAAPLLLLGCNTAQLQVPTIDAGGDSGPCISAPAFVGCDAGAPDDSGTTPCGENPEAGITPAAYPLGCVATTHHYTPFGDCAIQYICTCSRNVDAGAGYWACQE